MNTSSSTTDRAVLPEEAKSKYKCDHCDFESKSLRGLKTHIGHKHKELEDLEIIRETHSQDKSLELLENGKDRDELSLPLANSTINEEETVIQPIILKMQENGLAKVELVAPNETPPAKVLHTKLGIGTSPEHAKFEDKNCIKYSFEKGKFLIEIFQAK